MSNSTIAKILTAEDFLNFAATSCHTSDASEVAYAAAKRGATLRQLHEATRAVRDVERVLSLSPLRQLHDVLDAARARCGAERAAMARGLTVRQRGKAALNRLQRAIGSGSKRELREALHEALQYPHLMLSHIAVCIIHTGQLISSFGEVSWRRLSARQAKLSRLARASDISAWLSRLTPQHGGHTPVPRTPLQQIPQLQPNAPASL